MLLQDGSTKFNLKASKIAFTRDQLLARKIATAHSVGRVDRGYFDRSCVAGDIVLARTGHRLFADHVWIQ